MWGTLMPFGSKAKFRGHRRHTLKDVAEVRVESRSNLLLNKKGGSPQAAALTLS
jgi:hypothetical protein